MRRLKISAVVASLAITIGVLGSHTTNSLWPWVPVSVGIAVLAILAGVLWGPDSEVLSTGPILALITSIAVFYRAYTYIFPASLIGLDPDGYAVWINQLITTGTLETMSVGFYQRAPLFPLINALFSIVSGTPVRDAMIIIPIVVGLIVPVSAYILAQYIPSSSIKTGLVAALIIIVSAQNVKQSYWPVAQTLAAVYLVMYFIVSVRLASSSRNNKKFFILFSLFLLGIVLTHKLPVLIAALFTGSFALIATLPQSIAQPLNITRTNQSMVWMLFSLTSVFLLVQWIYITGFINAIVEKTIVLFVDESAQSVTISPERMNPTAAIRPYSPLVGILLRNLHSLILLVAGAIAWLILAYTERNSPAVRTLLIAAGVLFIFFPITLFIPQELTYTRIELFIEPIVAVLIAAALINWIDQSQYTFRRVLKMTSIGILVLIVTAQVATVGAAPDFPGTTRVYLTSEEATAKEFGHQYVENSLTEPYYNHEEPFPDRRVAASGELKTERINKYAPLTETLYNASLLSDCPPKILSRSSDFHRFQGSWRLTWDLQSALDQHYSRVYSSGGANHYVRSKCT